MARVNLLKSGGSVKRQDSPTRLGLGVGSTLAGGLAPSLARGSGSSPESIHCLGPINRCPVRCAHTNGEALAFAADVGEWVHVPFPGSGHYAVCGYAKLTNRYQPLARPEAVSVNRENRGA